MPYVVLLLSMLLWASTFIAVKYIFLSFDPVFVLFARMAIAMLCLLPLLGVLRVSLRVRREDWRSLLLLGLCQPCLYFLFESAALKLTSASQASVLAALIPVLATLSAWLWLREPQRAGSWAGVVISTMGALALTLASPASANAPNPLLGNFLELLAVLCGVGYMLLLKRLAARYAPLTIIFIQTMIGLLWFGFGLLTPWGTWPTAWPFWPCVWLVYLGAVVTLGAFALYTWAISRVPVAHAAVFTNLIPLFSMALAFMLLDERLTRLQWLACLAILLGVWLGQRSGGKPVPQGDLQQVQG
ncbi:MULTISPECIES: DMT family transporter [unclassified Paludibacterium]|uniref:DMT family transporter n=1 Tax=unclassified Paludibacterium TaxID=2618429 RepID=UPI001C050A0D|nr:DMT family transporter [Paludibacterium sp. B53371]BEV73810.1 DMT family transporter [Paludibacterium sp. THUN1379]